MASKWWYFTGLGDDTWASMTNPPDYDNWFDDAAHTSPAMTLPDNGDSVYFDGTTVPSDGPVAGKTFAYLTTKNFAANGSFGDALEDCSATILEWGRYDYTHNGIMVSAGSDWADIILASSAVLYLWDNTLTTGSFRVRGSGKIVADPLPTNAWLMDKIEFAGGAFRSATNIRGAVTIKPSLTNIIWEVASSTVLIYGSVLIQGAVGAISVGNATFWLADKNCELQWNGTMTWPAYAQPLSTAARSKRVITSLIQAAVVDP